MFKWATDLIKGLRKNNPRMYLYRSGWDLNDRETTYGSMAAWVESPGSGSLNVVSDSSLNTAGAKKMDERIAKKPVDVFKEMIAETPKMDVNNLDAQIKLVNRRKKMFNELGVMAGDEDEALIFLNSRKAGLKAKTTFGWAVTTLPMIDALLKKYKLAMVSFETYAKNVPMEAIDELEKFLKEYQKVSDTKPVLRLIIDDAAAPGDQVSKERKKDPILLASSPFGRFFYILGAWDKEVEVVDDLVYHGK